MARAVTYLRIIIPKPVNHIDIFALLRIDPCPANIVDILSPTWDSCLGRFLRVRPSSVLLVLSIAVSVLLIPLLFLSCVSMMCHSRGLFLVDISFPLGRIPLFNKWEHLTATDKADKVPKGCIPDEFRHFLTLRYKSPLCCDIVATNRWRNHIYFMNIKAEAKLHHRALKKI
jgi:hypothetical protein